jgi:YbgC/YbaW family acyl-CoA thioester hydrolase
LRGAAMAVRAAAGGEASLRFRESAERAEPSSDFEKARSAPAQLSWGEGSVGEPARCRLKVRHYEVDGYGHVNHASYVHYLETGRVEALEAVGLSLDEMRRQGYLIVAVELVVRYHASARAGETLEVITRIREIRGARTVWVQEIRETTARRLLVTAEVIGALMTEDGRPVRIPAAFVEKLSTLAVADDAPANRSPRSRSSPA